MAATAEIEASQTWQSRSLRRRAMDRWQSALLFAELSDRPQVERVGRRQAPGRERERRGGDLSCSARPGLGQPASQQPTLGFERRGPAFPYRSLYAAKAAS
jgi:hypothetical protein